jgi:sRNA-binding protein
MTERNIFPNLFIGQEIIVEHEDSNHAGFVMQIRPNWVLVQLRDGRVIQVFQEQNILKIIVKDMGDGDTE